MLALGELTPYAVQEFGPNARHYERLEDLLAALKKHLDATSTVLVKGSRFMHMERVVQHCVEDREPKPENRRSPGAAGVFLSSVLNRRSSDYRT